MTTAQIQIPPKLIPVFSKPRGSYRYRGAYGGRGSAKTRTFALMTAVFAYMAAENGESGVILCLREFVNSLDDSSMEEVKQAIKSVPWLDAYFEIGEKFIRTKNRRISYSFSGLRHNLNSIKSKARILIAWVDEAEPVPEIAWRKLIPTIRGDDDAEIWITWNPEVDGSSTDNRFKKSTPANSIIVEMNYCDNPWFPSVLEQERLNDKNRLDDATYGHIWEGAYLVNSNAQVLAGKYRVDEFEPQSNWSGPHQGLDYGFSQDPTAAVRCWDYDNTLYIEYEAGEVGLELDETADYICSRIPGFENYVTRGDSARPESTSYLQRHGMPRVQNVKKWPGSVEDGIQHLRSYKEIVIHPRCVKTAEEARIYSYKVDKNTGEVLSTLVDANNHYIDAIRYALGEKIKSGIQAGIFKRKKRS